MSGRRVVHDELGPGEAIDYGFCGHVSVVSVRFDGTGDIIIVEEGSLMPEIGGEDAKIRRVDKGDEGSGEVKKDSESGAIEKHKEEFEIELEKIRAEALEYAKEIEEMNNETLIEAFEFNIRQGAGPDARSVVFMKREVLKRMNKKDSDKI